MSKFKNIFDLSPIKAEPTRRIMPNPWLAKYCGKDLAELVRKDSLYYFGRILNEGDLNPLALGYPEDANYSFMRLRRFVISNYGRDEWIRLCGIFNIEDLILEMGGDDPERGYDYAD